MTGFYYSGVVDGNDETVVNLPLSVAISYNDRTYKGVYLKADRDAVTVVGQNEINQYSETFLILPYKRSSIKSEYVHYGISTRGYDSNYQGVMLIVGTEDNTTMKLTVTQTATTNYGHTYNPGTEYSFVINRLQPFYIRSSSYLSDLTGTKVVTDKQVSVFSGHERAKLPRTTCCDDQLIEQVPPVSSWGRVFYTMPLATRRYYTIKILASHNYTWLDFYCNNLKTSYTIGEEEHFSRILSQEYCVIWSNKPVLVTQFGHSRDQDGVGDPMMMIVPDVLQFTNRFTTTTIRNPNRSGYRHYVNIIVLARYYQPDMIHLISGGRNTTLNTQTWMPIRVNYTTEAYSTQVSVSEGAFEITHDNIDGLMIVATYGFTSYEGYGHPGRLGYETGLFFCYA